MKPFLKHFKRNEILGLVMIYLGGTLLGLGLYATFWGANRPLFYSSVDQLIQGYEWLIFPGFYGLGFLLLALGKIEIKEVKPRKKD